MKFCHTQKKQFKLGFESLPFHKIFPEEFQLIKQMIAKYPQCQPFWLLLRTTKANFCHPSPSMLASSHALTLPPGQVCVTITMCANIELKARHQETQSLQENTRHV